MNEKQKIVLVTGSSRGIGKGIALEMARQGYAVVVHGSTESTRLRATFEEVNRHEPGLDLRGGRARRQRGDPQDVRRDTQNVRPPRRPGQQRRHAESLPAGGVEGIGLGSYLFGKSQGALPFALNRPRR